MEEVAAAAGHGLAREGAGHVYGHGSSSGGGGNVGMRSGIEGVDAADPDDDNSPFSMSAASV